MNLYALGGLVLAGALAIGVQTVRLSSAQADLASERQERAEEREKAAQERLAWAESERKLRDAKDSEIRRVAAARDRALRELRDRPERLPEPAREACKGATGAELSRRDAEFLAGLAARADELRAALRACQGGE